MHLLNLGIPKWTIWQCMHCANPNASGNYFRAINDLWQPLNERIFLWSWVEEKDSNSKKQSENMWKFSENSCTQTSTQVPALQILHGPKHKGQGTSPGRSRLSLATAFLSWGTRTCAVGSAKGTKWIKMSTNAQLKFWKKNQTPRFICHPKSPSDCSKGISSLAPQSCWKIRCFPHRS